MQIPMIHPNGTSKERLIETLCEASNALEAAYQALKKTAPNARDYPMDPMDILQAEQEHSYRLGDINEVKEQIDAMTVAIDQI